MGRPSKKRHNIKQRNINNVNKRYKKCDSEVNSNKNCEVQSEVSFPQLSNNEIFDDPEASTSNGNVYNRRPEPLTGFALYNSYNDKVEIDKPAANYLIVDKGLLSKFICAFPCSECLNKNLMVSDISLQGYASIFKVKCEACEYKTTFETSARSGLAQTNSTRPPYDINRRMVQAFSSIGKGHRGLQTFSMHLNMKPIQLKSYKWHLDKIHTIYVESAKENLEKARCEVCKTYTQVENLPLDFEGPYNISVSYDGGWQKRGFTSKNGVGCCVEVLTGLVIDYEVLSKYCRICELMKIKLGKDSDEFKNWVETHKSKCQQNYDGSSPNMEVVAAERIWERSKKHGFQYTTLVSDGDSKTHTHLTSVKPYGELEIEKVECLNHVAKRLGTGLRKIVAENTGKGDPLGGKKHGSLKAITIDKLTGYYRNAIQNNLGDTTKMNDAIFATLKHCNSNDNKPQHEKCPQGEDSWCFFNRAIAKNEIPKSHDKMLKTPLRDKVVEKILPLYKRLSSDKLLQRCVTGKTQNANEALHGVIWSKCPKTKFSSRKRLEIGVSEAICQYNTGCNKSVSDIQKLGGTSPGSITSKIAKSFDRKRLHIAKFRKDTKYSEYKKKVRQAQLQEEERKKEMEGLTYGAGEF